MNVCSTSHAPILYMMDPLGFVTDVNNLLQYEWPKLREYSNEDAFQFLDLLHWISVASRSF